MSPSFYVYLHRRASDLTPMYVGKGSGKRAWSRNNRNIHWHRSVEKYGLDVAIVCTGLTFDQANQKEIELIAELGRRDQCCGPLFNMTDGGDGRVGFVHSAEARRLISERNKGRVPSAEQRARMSAARRGHVVSVVTRQRISDSNWGRKRSEDYLLGLAIRSARLRHSHETKAKMSAARSGERSYMYGVPKTAEMRQRISAALKGRYAGELNPRWGKTHTTEARDKIRAARASLIQCSNGMVFLGCEKAAEWVRTQGHPKASKAAIHAAVKGRIVKSYGLGWQLAIP